MAEIVRSNTRVWLTLPGRLWVRRRLLQGSFALLFTALGYLLTRYGMPSLLPDRVVLNVANTTVRLTTLERRALLAVRGRTDLDVNVELFRHEYRIETSGPRRARIEFEITDRVSFIDQDNESPGPPGRYGILCRKPAELPSGRFDCSLTDADGAATYRQIVWTTRATPPLLSAKDEEVVIRRR